VNRGTPAITSRTGLTLVEVVAVVCILAIAATIMLAAARPYSQTHQRHAAIGAVRETMERARILAAADGEGAELMVLGGVLVATPRSRPLPEVRAALGNGWTAQLYECRPGSHTTSEQDRVETLPMDALGCTIDAEMHLRSSFTQVRLMLLGLSGELHESPGADGVWP